MSDSDSVSNSSQPMQLVVGLVVSTGSRAGVMAEIKEGIYMIGRDRECQIRPKSQSVSDRHCLVQHQSDVVRVFDLGSEEGTFVNEQMIAPKTWSLLNHGDQLRCGRYSFEVVIHLKGDHVPSRSVVRNPMETEVASIGRDVNRYQLSTDNDFTTEAVEPDEAELEDDFEFDNLAEIPAPSRPSVDSPELQPSSMSGPTKAAKNRAPLPKPKISYRSPSRFSGLSFDLGGPDAWKMWVACIAMIATLGYVGWTAYQLKNGSQPKIIRGID
jgi:pSer/pThr/pTyr-binding forkhead associated (FHA) protein